MSNQSSPREQYNSDGELSQAAIKENFDKANKGLSLLSGPKILLMGPSGTGKTYSIGTLVDWAAVSGKRVFVQFSENGLETLLGYWRDKSKPVPENLYWQQMLTKPISLKGLINAADAVGKLSYESLTKMSDPNRGGENNAYMKLISACTTLKDDRTGKEQGPIDELGLGWIFVQDSLSELANAAFKMQIGARPTASPSDYGVAQNNLMNWLRFCTQGISSTYVLTAHISRETDEITQSTKIMVKAVGKAMANEIPQLFSDVILSVREADKFYWDTAAYGVDTKTRSLGYRSKLEPNFASILEVWKKRSGA